MHQLWEKMSKEQQDAVKSMLVAQQVYMMNRTRGNKMKYTAAVKKVDQLVPKDFGK